MKNIAIIEDDREIGILLEQYLKKSSEFSEVTWYGSVESLLNRQHRNFPGIVLMDIELPGMSGIEGIRLLKEDHPGTDFIVLTVYNDTDKIFQSLCAGASGYLVKNTPLEKIRESIQIVLEGGSPLTPQIARRVVEYFKDPSPGKNARKSPLSLREKEIVIGLVDGLSYKLIADRMSISIDTVRYHIKNIYKKLQVNSKAEVISKSVKGEI
jgi:DNA-binding NarL/FixJ family response regulator